MKLRLLLIALPFTLLSLTACQNGYRKPSSTSGEINLKTETEYILKDIQNPSKFNLGNCAPYISEVYADVLALQPTRFNADKTKEEWLEIYKNLWTIRVKLRERYVDFYNQLVALETNKGRTPQEVAENPDLTACSVKMRDGFRLSRWIEDYLAETFSGEPQDFVAGDSKYVVDKNFAPNPLRGEAPWFVKTPKYATEAFKIKSGDIITSRGNAYTSSAIARIADVDSQFSHLAVIYIKDSDKGQEYTIDEALELKDSKGEYRVQVLEAHIEVGSTIRPFKEYLADGNARNVVFRYGDFQIAHRSARFVYDYIRGYRQNSFDANPWFDKNDVNHNVPYNFQMNLDNPKNPKKMFCSQVAHVGFSSQNVAIPLFISKVNTKLSLVRRMGITPKKGSNSAITDIFTPGDMEVDPRFEMLGEFRNLRKLKGLRMKDMVLSSMYRMMDKGYELTPLPTIGTKALTGWILRQMDLKLVKQQLPKNMNTKILSTSLTLEEIAITIEKALAIEEERYKTTTKGLGLSFAQGLEAIERIKDKDREVYFSGKKPEFHWSFSHPLDRAEFAKRNNRDRN